MNNNNLPEIVGDEEIVARIIFSPSYIYEGRVSPTAFRWEMLPSGDAEEYISVLRGHENELEQQTRTFRARTKGDSRYGYATLRTGSVRAISKDDAVLQRVTTDVVAYPSKRHPNHAGITAEINGNKVTANSNISPEIMMLQKKLATLCSAIKRF